MRERIDSFFCPIKSFEKERMRELQAQAAEKRMRENETKGIQNIESVKRQQAKKEQMESMANNANQSGNLKVVF